MPPPSSEIFKPTLSVQSSNSSKAGGAVVTLGALLIPSASDQINVAVSTSGGNGSSYNGRYTRAFRQGTSVFVSAQAVNLSNDNMSFPLVTVVDATGPASGTAQINGNTVAAGISQALYASPDRLRRLAAQFAVNFNKSKSSLFVAVTGGCDVDGDGTSCKPVVSTRSSFATLALTAVFNQIPRQAINAALAVNVGGDIGGFDRQSDPVNPGTNGTKAPVPDQNFTTYDVTVSDSYTVKEAFSWFTVTGKWHKASAKAPTSQYLSYSQGVYANAGYQALRGGTIGAEYTQMLTIPEWAQGQHGPRSAVGTLSGGYGVMNNPDTVFVAYTKKRPAYLQAALETHWNTLTATIAYSRKLGVKPSNNDRDYAIIGNVQYAPGGAVIG